MALFEVVLNTSYVGQNCVNRWNYVSGGTPGAVTPAFALAFALGAIYDEAHIPPQYTPGTLLSDLALTMSQAAVFQQITVINVYDPVDFYQTPFVPPYAGQINAGGVSPALSMGYRTNIVNRDIGRGFKRFVGLPDNAESDGGQLTPEHEALMADLAETMSAVLEYDDEGNTLTFAPAICSKHKYVPDPLKPTKFAYEYYDTLAEQLTHTATGIRWEIYNTARTQTSRQYGRGS